jgi:L,D-transpeptidase ErfK/SrfK
MIRKFAYIISLMVCVFFVTADISASDYFNKQLCSQTEFECMKVKKHDSWNSLFPDYNEQTIIKRINRMNVELQPGMILAIPKNLTRLDIALFAPFPPQIVPADRKLIIIDLSDQAFGAYNAAGELVYWGPVSAGRGYCPDVARGCHTPVGTHYIYSKGGPDCISSKYPIPEGGAPMPFCMFFHGGYALHGSVLPGYNASHGCVRLFSDDAEWLNKEFVETGRQGTKVIVRE